MERMVTLMKEVYGVEEYNKKNKYAWEVLADKCHYVSTPEQGPNECGFYALKVAFTFDGDKFVVKIKNKDVSMLPILNPFIAPVSICFVSWLLFFMVHAYTLYLFSTHFVRFVFLCSPAARGGLEG